MYKKLTTAIKRDRTLSIFTTVEGDSNVCSAIEDLSKGQRSHITPVLEGRADGLGDICPLHVRGVVVDAVGQTPFSPKTCKGRIATTQTVDLNTSVTFQVSHISFKYR